MAMPAGTAMIAFSPFSPLFHYVPQQKPPKSFVVCPTFRNFAAETTKKEGMDMSFDQLDFVTFCVGSLSDYLKMSAGKVYGMLRSSGILNGYILPCYDVLHTFSKEYIVEDLTDCMKERGLLT